MSGNGNGPNRRDVLKKLGAAGLVGAASVPSLAAADDRTISERDAQDVLATKEVTAIRSELGSFAITEITRRRGSVENRTLEVTRIQTKTGELRYGKSGAGETIAQFTFSDGVAQSQYPRAHRPVPQSSDAILVAKGSAVTFMRTATDRERRTLLQKLDVPVEELVAFYNSDIGGFEVQVETRAGNRRAFGVETPGNGDVQAGSVSEIVTDDEVSTQGCATWCFGCAASVGACGGCIMSCASVVTLVGAIGCAVCVVGSCGGAVPIACTKCVDECS